MPLNHSCLRLLALLLGGTYSLGLSALTLEAEQAEFHGQVSSSRSPLASGYRYTQGYKSDADYLEFTIQHPATERLQARLRYRTPHGKKGIDFTVNSESNRIMLPASNRFTSIDAGLVTLQKGRNIIRIGGGWHYYEIDALELVPAPPIRPLRAVPATLVSPRASRQAQALFARLQESYGHSTLSGQQEASELAHIETVTGRRPVIIGGDLVIYSPYWLTFGGQPDTQTRFGTTADYLAAAKSGHVISLAWHWHAPADNKARNWSPGASPFYSKATRFPLAEVLDQPDSPRYALLLRDIDAIAVELRRYQQAGVPILWRPLHEAEGGWFWWGAHGPEMLKRLWRLLFQRLTELHGLDNLIWVYSFTTELDMTWYPGDAFVDIVGVDAYPKDRSATLNAEWQKLHRSFDGRKLIALTEVGGAPDTEAMHEQGVRWAYFLTWEGAEQGPRSVPRQRLSDAYRAPVTITLDEWRGSTPPDKAD